MAARDKRQIEQILASARFAGSPLFFFDTSFLLANITSLAGWNQTRLEAAIAPRIETRLSPEDACFTAENGFYVAFAKADISIAWDIAKAICDDIFRHFYGHGDYDPENVGKFCRQSSAREAADDFGIELASEQTSRHRGQNGHASTDDDLSESEQEKRLFKRELVAIFMEHFSSNSESGKFLFSPCWDSKKESITSFECEAAAKLVSSRTADPEAPGLAAATAQCKRDVIALAVATRGLRHVVSRGDVAAVSAPVHVETLSWSKTRHGYIDVLAEIEPRYLMLLAPRIKGLIAGSNLSPIAQWIAELRCYVRRSFVHLPNVDFDISRDGVLGATGFGLNLTSSMRASTAPHGVLAMQTAKLKRICANQNAIACIGNVASLDELFLLKLHGVRLIAGPVIEKPSELPGPVGPLSFADALPIPQAKAEQALPAE